MANGWTREVGPVVGGLAVFGFMIVLTYEVALDERSMIYSGDSDFPILMLWGTGLAVGVMRRLCGKLVWAAAWLIGAVGAVVACLGVSLSTGPLSAPSPNALMLRCAHIRMSGHRSASTR